MYISMYIHTYLCVYTYISIYMRIHMYIYIYISINLSIYLYIHIYIYVYVYVGVSKNEWAIIQAANKLGLYFEDTQKRPPIYRDSRVLVCLAADLDRLP